MEVVGRRVQELWINATIRTSGRVGITSVRRIASGIESIIMTINNGSGSSAGGVRITCNSRNVVGAYEDIIFNW